MSGHPIRRRVLQILGVSAALGVMGVAVIGFAHTEHGRPLLKYIPGMGACPLDVAPLTAEDRMRVRGEVLAPLLGDQAAVSRKALAFELGRTTADEVSTWATSHRIACAPGRKLALRCTSVPAQSTGQATAFDAVSFDFDMDGRLVMVEASASLDDAAKAADYVATRDLALRDNLGAPTTSRGAARAETVTRGALSQILREFRRSDVRAQVVATNSGLGRFTIREFHQFTAGRS
jgi:hypothetical protein